MKQLAIFLGANTIEEKSLNPLIRKWNSPNFKPLDGRFVSGHELKFNSDWSWLLAVVHKLHTINQNVDVEHWGLFGMLFEDITIGILTNNIERVCNDCIELVKYIEIHNIKING